MFSGYEASQHICAFSAFLPLQACLQQHPLAISAAVALAELGVPVTDITAIAPLLDSSNLRQAATPLAQPAAQNSTINAAPPRSSHARQSSSTAPATETPRPPASQPAAAAAQARGGSRVRTRRQRSATPQQSEPEACENHAWPTNQSTGGSEPPAHALARMSVGGEALSPGQLAAVRNGRRRSAQPVDVVPGPGPAVQSPILALQQDGSKRAGVSSAVPKATAGSRKRQRTAQNNTGGSVTSHSDKAVAAAAPLQTCSHQLVNGNTANAKRKRSQCGVQAGADAHDAGTHMAADENACPSVLRTQQQSSGLATNRAVQRLPPQQLARLQGASGYGWAGLLIEGAAHMHAAQAHKASVAYARLSELFPGELTSVLCAAEAALVASDCVTARSAFARARSLDPHNVALMDVYAVLLLETGDFDDLRQLSRDVMDLDLSLPEVWAVMATYWQGRGDWDKAQQYAERCGPLLPWQLASLPHACCLCS